MPLHPKSEGWGRDDVVGKGRRTSSEIRVEAGLALQGNVGAQWRLVARCRGRSFFPSQFGVLPEPAQAAVHATCNESRQIFRIRLEQVLTLTVAQIRCTHKFSANQIETREMHPYVTSVL